MCVCAKGRPTRAPTKAAEPVVLCVILSLLDVVSAHHLDDLCVLVHKAHFLQELLLMELERAHGWRCVCVCVCGVCVRMFGSMCSACTTLFRNNTGHATPEAEDNSGGEVDDDQNEDDDHKQDDAARLLSVCEGGREGGRAGVSEAANQGITDGRKRGTCLAKARGPCPAS